MSLANLINRPCTITHRSESGVTDDYGNDVSAFTETATVCELQQRQRDEPADSGEVSATEWSIFLLPPDSLHTGDKVTVDNEVYEIVGEPWRARNPRTRQVEHVEATARRVAGDADEVGS